MKSRSCFVLLALLPILAACEEEPPPVAERVRAIKTITVTDIASGQLRRFPGVVDAVDTSTLSFEVGGNIKELLISAGDKVEEGQVLASLDATPFQLNVDAAKAEVGRAKAQLAEKETEFFRKDTLYKKGWVAKAAFDQALAGRDSAKNEVSYAASKLNLARRDLDKTVLAAPYGGVIAAKHAEAFQEVSRGQKVFDLYAEGAMEVVITVPETTISSLSLGLPAEVTFPSDKHGTLEGRVSEIGAVASEANAFPVKIALAGPPATILPGMTAEAVLILGGAEVETSYLVPISALAESDQPRQGYVFVFDPQGSTVSKVKVLGGGVRDDFVVITEGLAAGDIIAVAGVSFLRDGQKVRLMAQ